MSRFVTILGVTLALLAPGAIALVADRYAGPGQPLAIRALGLVAFGLLIALVALIARVGEGLRAADVGFRRSSWRSPLRAVLLTLFLIFVYGPLVSAALVHTGASFDAGRAQLAGLPPWYAVLLITIVAGGEEWLYRGYAIERLEAVTGSSAIASAVSLAAFVIAHIPMWGGPAALSTLVAGAIFTALYLWQRDIALLILAHIATDTHGLLIVPVASNS